MSDMYKQQFISQFGSMADEFSHIDGIGNPIFFLVQFPRIVLFILIFLSFVMFRRTTVYKSDQKKREQNNNLFYLTIGLTIAAAIWVIWITGWVEVPQSQKWRAKLFANDKALGMWEKYNNARHQEEVESQLDDINSELRYNRYNRDNFALENAALDFAIR